MNDANRSLALESLLPILNVPGVQFYSLQKGAAAAQLEGFIGKYPIVDWTADLHDFADTAALLPHLDLVIAVDTAIVHLAGAIGKEAWVLINYKPDFRWACDAERSGWYDSVRLFRQPVQGDWSSAIGRVADELRRRVSRGVATVHAAPTPTPAPATSPTAAPAPTPAALSPVIESTLRLAHEHHSAGRLTQAEPLYREVLAQAPANADATHHLGLIALQCGQMGPAIQLMTRSISIAPQNPFFYKNLASACRSAGKLDDAIDWLQRGIAIAPDEPSMHEELGVILEKLDRLDESIAEHTKAINAIAAKSPAVDPARRSFEAKAYLNLGTSLQRQQRFDEAIGCFDRAIELVPDYPLAHTHRATVLFRRRHLREAWTEYEWRFRCKGFPTPWRSYPQPTWDGSELGGRTILLWPEQGLGDIIQFARFVPEVVARGGRVIVECSPLLKGVLQTLPVPVTVVGTGEPLPSFDVHLPLLSVPRVLGTTYETIPAPESYLRADPQRVEQWAGAFRGMGASPINARSASGDTGGAPVPRNLRVGVVWSGSASFAANYRRSIPLDDLLPLGDVPGIEWHSLQLGDAARQGTAVADRLLMIDHSTALHDFADTAALLANLDLLISTDTATVHLAGALGVETWVLLWTERDYRWLIDDGERTRWYPRMRVFQQTKAHAWNDVVQRVHAALAERASAART
jgi:tetratricopeptide (TPR) repeat protein